MDDQVEPVQVFIRIRPEGNDEVSSLSLIRSPNSNNNKYESCITVIDDKCIQITPPDGIYGTRKTINSVSLDSKRYTFDQVFPSHVSQEEIYSHVQSHVLAAIRGYNSTIFAYGVTGSGKSHTMTGTKNMPGIIPRAISDIFKNITMLTNSNDIYFFVRLSYVELYNNVFRNLLEGVKEKSSDNNNKNDKGPISIAGFFSELDDLATAGYEAEHGPTFAYARTTAATLQHQKDIINTQSNKIEVRESTSAGVFLSGHNLRFSVTSAAEAFQLIAKGNKNRAVAATNCNDQSSRSHAILTFHVESRVMNAASFSLSLSSNSHNIVPQSPNLSSSSAPSPNTPKPEMRIGKIHLVDLAGSERLTISGADGETLTETKNINSSLSALGDVLSALSKNSMALSHQMKEGLASPAKVEMGSPNIVPVPYRNSKLTHLLKDSLGGNSKTIMITTIRQGSNYYQQTAISLMYSARAKKVRNKSIINRNSIGDSGGIHSVNSEFERLKKSLEDRALEFERLKLLQLNDQKENMSLKKRLEEMKIINDQEKKLLEQQVSKLIHSQAGYIASQKEKITNLQGELQNELLLSQNRIAEQNEEIKWLKNALNESNKNVSNDDVEKLKHSIEVWQNQAKSTRSELTTVLTQAETLKNINTNLEEKILNLTNDNNNLKTLLTNKENEALLSIDIEKKYTKEINDLKNQLKKSQTSYDEMKIMLNSQLLTQSERENVNKENTKLISSLKLENDELKKKIELIELNNKNLQNDLKNSQIQLNDIKKEKFDLQNSTSQSLQDLQNLLEQKSKNLIDTESKLMKLQDDFDKVSYSLKEIQSISSSKLNERQTNIDELNRALETATILTSKQSIEIESLKDSIERLQLKNKEANEAYSINIKQKDDSIDLIIKKHEQERITLMEDFERILQEKVYENQKSILDIETDYKAKLKEMEDTIEEKVSYYNSILSKTQSDSTSIIKDKIEYFNEELKKKDEDYKKKIDSINLNHEKELENLVNDYNIKMNKLETSLQNEKETALQQLEDALTRDHQKEIRSILLKKDEELNKTETDSIMKNNQELQKVRSMFTEKMEELQNEINDLKLSHRKELNKLNESTTNLTNDYEAQIELLKNELKQKNEKILLNQTDFENEKSLLKIEYDNNLSKIKKDYEIQIQNLIDEHDQSFRKFSTEKSKNITDQITTLSEEHSNEISKLIELNKKEIQRLNEKHAEILSEVENNLLNKFEDEKKKLIQSYDEEKKNLIQSFDEEKKNLTQSFEEENKNLIQSYESKIEEKLTYHLSTTKDNQTQLETEYQNKLASIEESYSLKLKDKEQNIIDLNNKLKDLMESHQVELSSALLEQQKDLLEKSKQQIDSLRSQITQLQEQNNEEISTLQSQHAINISQLKLTLESSHHTVVNQLKLEIDIANNKIEELTRSLETAKIKAEENSSTKIQSLIDSYESRISEWQEKYDLLSNRQKTQLDSLRETYQKELSEKDNENELQLQNIKQMLKDRHNREINEIKLHHEEEISFLNNTIKLKENELSRLQDELKNSNTNKSLYTIELENQLNLNNKEKEEILLKNKKDKQDLINKHNQYIQELEEKHTNELKTLEDNSMEIIKSLKDNHKNSINDLISDYDLKLNEKDKYYKDIINKNEENYSSLLSSKQNELYKTEESLIKEIDQLKIDIMNSKQLIQSNNKKHEEDLEELKNNLKLKYDEDLLNQLNNEKNNFTKQLKDLENEFEGRLKLKNDEINSLNLKLNEMSVKHEETLQIEIQKNEELKNQVINNISSNYQDKISEIEDKLKSEKELVETSKNEEINDLKKQIDLLNLSITDLKNQHLRNIEERQAEFDGINRMRINEHSRLIEELKANHSQELSKRDYVISELQFDIDQLKNNLNSSYSTVLNDLENTYKEKLKAVELSLESEKSKLQRQLEFQNETISKYENNLQGEIATLKEIHAKELNDLRQSTLKEIVEYNKASKEKDEKVNELSSKIKDYESIISDYKLQIKLSDNNITLKEDELERLKTNHTNTLTSIENKWKEKESELSTQINILTQKENDYKKEIESIKKTYTSHIDSLKESFEAEKENHINQLANFDSRNSSLIVQYQQQIEESKLAHDKYISTLKSQHQSEILELQSQYNNNLQMELNSQKQKQKFIEDQLIDTQTHRDSLQRQLQTLTYERDSLVEDLKKFKESQINLIKQNEINLDDIQKHHTSMFEREKANLTERYELEIQALNQRLDRLKETEKKYISSASEIDSLVAQNSDLKKQVDNLLVNYNDLSRKLEKEEHDKNSIERQLANEKISSSERLESIQSVHRHELENVNNEWKFRYANDIQKLTDELEDKNSQLNLLEKERVDIEKHYCDLIEQEKNSINSRIQLQLERQRADLKNEMSSILRPQIELVMAMIRAQKSLRRSYISNNGKTTNSTLNTENYLQELQSKFLDHIQSLPELWSPRGSDPSSDKLRFDIEGFFKNQEDTENYYNSNFIDVSMHSENYDDQFEFSRKNSLKHLANASTDISYSNFEKGLRNNKPNLHISTNNSQSNITTNLRASPTDQLISAILDGNVQGIRAVVRSKGEDLNSPFWVDIIRSILPLHRAISGLHFHGSDQLLISTLDVLISLGADINALDHTGNNAIHKAIQVCTSKSVYSIVKCLIQKGVNPNSVNKEGDTPLHAECKKTRSASVQVIELLINHGAHPNDKQKFNHMSALTIALLRGACTTQVGISLINQTAIKNSITQLQENELVWNNNWLSINFSESIKETKSSEASPSNYWLKVIEILLRSGAVWDPSWRSPNGVTQLHLFLSAFPPSRNDMLLYRTVLKNALEYGLSPSVEDSKGRNSLFILCEVMSTTPLSSCPDCSKIVSTIIDYCPSLYVGSSDRTGRTIFDMEGFGDDSQGSDELRSCLSSCRDILIQASIKSKQFQNSPNPNIHSQGPRLKSSIGSTSLFNSPPTYSHSSSVAIKQLNNNQSESISSSSNNNKNYINKGNYFDDDDDDEDDDHIIKGKNNFLSHRSKHF